MRHAILAHLIDVSASALACATRVLADTGNLYVVTHQATYEAGLEQLSAAARTPGRTLALFFGSNIGNFDPPGRLACLRMLRNALRPGDGLLIGADLVKPEADLLLAYDDPLGVTAAFNRNLIVRINRELGGSVDPAIFDHRAIWNARESRIEMHLLANRASRVCIPAAGVDVDLSRGETVWTESSHKFDVGALERTLLDSGFRGVARWVDERDRFVLLLAIVEA